MLTLRVEACWNLYVEPDCHFDLYLHPFWVDARWLNVAISGVWETEFDVGPLEGSQDSKIKL